MIEKLSIAQQNFLIYCKQFGWGKIEVTVKNGEPVMVSPIKQETKLDTPDLLDKLSNVCLSLNKD